MPLQCVLSSLIPFSAIYSHAWCKYLAIWEKAFPKKVNSTQKRNSKEGKPLMILETEEGEMHIAGDT